MVVSEIACGFSAPLGFHLNVFRKKHHFSASENGLFSSIFPFRCVGTRAGHAHSCTPLVQAAQNYENVAAYNT